ncbi:hypothetical protein N7510_010583 [Penicillium lagena]|uniref:uncharacterized protein n=1 Tax=Penicillium lagena TaxID=94218 RepID=UPI002541AF3E|nr:uncharacterized protein N7510_010583 [Penicillium lagena]KAJ5601049.1 hypothetical protein N7510_010583 [Penicillium lagena]
MRNSEESSSTQPAPGSEPGAGTAQTSGDFKPHGRVDAKIVCDATLVQYAAYLLFLRLDFRDGGTGIIRFRSFGWGWRFTFFSLQVSVFSLLFRPRVRDWGGSGKICLFW